MKKIAYINVTYLESIEFNEDTPNEVIDQEVEDWIKENHQYCSDQEWDIDLKEV